MILIVEKLSIIGSSVSATMKITLISWVEMSTSLALMSSAPVVIWPAGAKRRNGSCESYIQGHFTYKFVTVNYWNETHPYSPWTCWCLDRNHVSRWAGEKLRPKVPNQVGNKGYQSTCKWLRLLLQSFFSSHNVASAASDKGSQNTPRFYAAPRKVLL